MCRIFSRYLRHSVTYLPCFYYKKLDILPLFCDKHLPLFRCIGICIRIYPYLYENYTQSGIIKRFSFTLYVFPYISNAYKIKHFKNKCKKVKKNC